MRDMFSKSRQNPLRRLLKSMTFPRWWARSKVSGKPHNGPPFQSPRRPEQLSQQVLNHSRRKYIGHRWQWWFVLPGISFLPLARVYIWQQLVCVGGSNLNWGRFLTWMIFKTGETTFRAPGDSQYQHILSYSAQKNTENRPKLCLF